MYTIPGVGTVAGGTVVRGSVREGDRLLMGPGDDGGFHPVTVGSIHRNRLPCRMVAAGQAACLSVGPLTDCPIRKVRIYMCPIRKVRIYYLHNMSNQEGPYLDITSLWLVVVHLTVFK